MIFSVYPKNVTSVSNRMNGYVTHKKKSFFMKELGQMREPKKGDYYYQQLHTLFLAWKFLGVFPFQVSKSGTLNFKLISATTCYSIIIYFMVTFMSYYNALDRINYFLQLGRFSFLHYMYTWLIILLLMAFPLAALAIWLQLNKIKNYIESWKEFQILYLKTINLPLLIQLKRRTNITVIAEVLAGSCVGLIAFVPPQQPFWRFIPHYFNMLFFDVLVSYWVITCVALQNANECLLKHFKIKTKEIVDHETIGKFRIVWLKLSQLSNQTGQAFSGVYIVIFVFEYVLITFSLYCFLSGINKEELTTLFGTLVAFIINVAPLYFMCNAAHETTCKINTDIKNELELLKSVNDKLVFQEASSFLQSMLQNPASISLSGFMTVNRGLFKSYACGIMTYLVVLMQFEVGLESNKGALLNSTSGNRSISLI